MVSVVWLVLFVTCGCDELGQTGCRVSCTLGKGGGRGTKVNNDVVVVTEG